MYPKATWISCRLVLLFQESMVTYTVLKEGGSKASVELTTLNNLHIFNEVCHVFSAFQKWTRAKTTHTTWMCYNELLLLCSLNLSHYPTHTTSQETTNPNHETSTFMSLQYIHCTHINKWIKCYNGCAIKQHLFNTMETRRSMIK